MRGSFFAAVLAVFLCFSAKVGAETIDTTASHAILMDAETGSILLDKNINERMPTSSMSKTLTLYAVFDALQKGTIKLEDEIQVSEKAWRMAGSKMFIRVGSNVKVEDLIRGVAIQSGNDATVALAEALAGTEEAFAERLNVIAKDLGMTNSHFMNASGWPDPEHYSTAHDLAILAKRIIADFPDHYHYFAEKEFTYNNIRQHNRDPLLGRLAGADGIKTGHTEAAGYGLIGSAIRQGRRLILVVNGLQSEKARQEESIRLLEWGFRNFENKKVLQKGLALETAEVWLGDKEKVSLVTDQDMTVTLPVSARADIKMSVTYMSPLKAPIKKGDAVAKLLIKIPGQSPRQVDLLAGEDVARKGFFGRAFAQAHYLLTERF